MTSDTQTQEGAPPRESPPEPPETGGDEFNPEQVFDVGRLLIGLVGMVVTGWLLCNVFLAFAYYPEWFFDSKILIGVLALIAGVGGAYLLFMLHQHVRRGHAGTPVPRP